MGPLGEERGLAIAAGAEIRTSLRSEIPCFERIDELGAAHHAMSVAESGSWLPELRSASSHHLSWDPLRTLYQFHSGVGPRYIG